ncbi:hypothetical protein B0H12DRAFT_1078011 [Mycena haematopus]|nr:hypothetical protein B0H12DRAFT_1078011 [Mycena haematopus]
MNLTSTLVLAVLAVIRGANPALVPQFGVNPTGTGDCDDINGIKIPCSYPPSRNDFIASLSANVAAGHDVNNPSIAAPFSTDSSQRSAVVRMQTSITALQNLHGPGVGCPAASTTFSAQLAALQNGTPPPAPASAQAPPASEPPQRLPHP